jgi:hypothetical protein
VKARNSLNVVGCFFGAIFAALFGEKLGRRKTIFIGAIVMLVGAVLQASSYSRAQIIVGRIVSGVGMGVINSTVPVVQAEFSPKATRGICKFTRRKPKSLKLENHKKMAPITYQRVQMSAHSCRRSTSVYSSSTG